MRYAITSFDSKWEATTDSAVGVSTYDQNGSANDSAACLHIEHDTCTEVLRRAEGGIWNFLMVMPPDQPWASSKELKRCISDLNSLGHAAELENMTQ